MKAWPPGEEAELAAVTESQRVVPMLGEHTLLADRYRVLRRLGSGGSGVVYEAADEARGGARVALKLLTSEQPGALLRLKNEFRALSMTVHPNLVGLHGLGVDRHGWFVVMDLVPESHDFVEFVRAGEPRSERLRAALLQLLEGVSALHAAGKLHRDLKPSNVLVSDQGRLVIVDFGLLGDAGGGSESSFLGTPAYAAPEQMLGRAVDGRADLYAVGVMIFQALFGRLPAESLDSDRLLRMKLRGPEHLEQVEDPTLRALCASLLAPDPSERPSAEQALAALGHTPAPREQRANEGHFVARERELAQLAEAAQRARTFGPGIVLVHGPSGIGKTALVARYAELAGADTVVLAGRCHPLEQVPYKAFDTLVDALARHLEALPRVEAASLMPRSVALLARLFPVLASVPVVMSMPLEPLRDRDTALMRTRAFAALRELFARIADRQPLLLCLDDLHWSDDDSMELLRELVSGVDAPACLVLCTLRSDHPRPAALDAALASLPGASCTELELPRLDDAACLQLARGLLGDGASSLALDEAAGSPLLLEQLARAARMHRVARDLAQTVHEWMAPLSPAERTLLELVCVAGHPVALRALVPAVAIDPESLRRVAHSWLLSTRVQHGEDQLEPRHDRLRETVLQTLSEPRLRELHAQLARALAATDGSDAERIAQHFWTARAYDEATPYLVRAADRALHTLAFARAAELYRRALSHATRDRDPLELSLAHALANMGHIAEAAARIEDVLARTTNPDERHALSREAMVLHVLAGHVEHAARLLDGACRELGESSVPREPWVALFSLATMSGLYSVGPRIAALPVPTQGEHTAKSKLALELSLRAARGFAQVSALYGEYFALRSLLAIRRHRDPERWPVGIAWEVLRRSMLRGDAEPGDERDMTRALALAEPQADRENLALVWAAEGGRCFVIGEYKRAVHAFQQSEDVLNASGRHVLPVFNGSRSGRLAAWLVLGDLERIRANTRVWRQEALAVGDRLGEMVVDVMGAYQWLADGDARRMRDATAVIETPFAQQTLFPCDPWWQGDPALYEGDTKAAWHAWQRARSYRYFHALRRVPAHRIGTATYLSRLHLLSAVQGRADQLPQVEKLARELSRERHPVGAPAAALMRAGLAMLARQPERALLCLEDAERGFVTLDMSIYATTAAFHAARLRGGESGRAEAQRAFARARTLGIREPEPWFHLLVPGFPR